MATPKTVSMRKENELQIQFFKEGQYQHELGRRGGIMSRNLLGWFGKYSFSATVILKTHTFLKMNSEESARGCADFRIPFRNFSFLYCVHVPK